MEPKKRGLALHWKILLGLGAGVLVGLLINQFWIPATWAALGVGEPSAFLAGKPSEANTEAGAGAYAARFIGNLADFIGKLFIRSLRFIAVPIVLFSLIAGAASLGDVRKLGRIGGRTLAMFAAMTVISSVVGIGLARVVRPGDFVGVETKQRLIAERAAEAANRAASGQAAMASKSGWERMLEVVPLNPFEALAKAEMLQIVLLSLILGCSLTLLPREKSAPVVAVCEAVTGAATKFIEVLMRLAPYAVFAIIATIVATVGLDVLRALGVYSLVVVAGLAMVLFGVYPLALRLGAPKHRIGFGRFMRAMAPVQLLAFTSSSSMATLPVNMECSRRRLGVPEEIGSFVLPLGATVNMNGTALYLSVVAVFLSQLYGLDLGLEQQVMLAVVATLSAVGAAGIPGASIALMVVVLETVQVPPEGIAIILGVDRVLDMCRTVVNVSGDAVTAAVVASREGGLKSPENDGAP